jgi:hypothetical protein
MINVHTNRPGTRVRRLLCVAGTAGLLAAGLAVAPAMGAPGSPSAPGAARPVPFTIHEVVVFGSPADPTFTAQGPICSAGTVHDDFTHTAAWKGAASKFFLMGSSVYTCADGSGTILARKKVFITYNEDGSLTNSGPFEITGGTGDYAGLRGNGFDVGVALVNPETGTVDEGMGTITGTIVP